MWSLNQLNKSFFKHTNMSKNLMLFLLVHFFLLKVNGQNITIGASKMMFENGAEPITLYTYKPATYKKGPIFVIFHGVQRNAEDYRNFAITLGEKFGAIIIAPLFDSVRFPSARYQKGGIMYKNTAQEVDRWTYTIIPKIISKVKEVEQNNELEYFLIGHSAGGQFLVRMAAFLPGNAVRIVAANPGSDLFPTKEQLFGYGFGGLPESLSNDTILKNYLAAPLTIYLGTDDIRPEHNFDVSPDGMIQGSSRLERGRNCYAYAKNLARQKGWKFNWKKVETKEAIDHNAARMFAAPEIKKALFGKK